jgi:glycine/D-amino acid oxidase-like deaminating enzyme
MALPSVRIDDMTDAGVEDPKDIFAFQRNVLGVWTDYHTDIETFMGGMITAVLVWDGTNNWSENILAPAGFAVVPISIQAIFTPGNSPSGQTAQMFIEQPPSTSGFIMNFDDGSSSYAAALQQIGVETDYVANEQLQFAVLTSLALDFSGTARITVQYILKELI